MPYVNIRITREGATPEQKARLIQGATELLVDVLREEPQTTVVTIDEVDTDNWRKRGETVTARRQQGNSPRPVHSAQAPYSTRFKRSRGARKRHHRSVKGVQHHGAKPDGLRDRQGGDH
ncbi:MAG: 4-oxalocrotonate tautomerase family protein [Holophagaceae bacterium]|uniref:4-oxalocrotonate tautomerase family protein n=1 Tax=Candidatus Geothrix odensensis TaxID=2954440 RepID=A0A936K734_9BACT|nr:4-oxalocrotonate tautomerase family protein [Candidatus Geothrix odensensis]